VKSLGNNLTEQNKGALFNYSKKVIDNKFADPTYKFKAALYMYDAGYQTESISIIEDLEIKDPKNLDFLNGLAYIYVKQGQLQDAIKVRKLIADNDPWNAENYLSLGSLLVQTGDNVLAKVYLSKIASFAPNTEVATKSQEIINSLG
jgi:Flp pilus assembly protein TadD